MPQGAQHRRGHGAFDQQPSSARHAKEQDEDDEAIEIRGERKAGLSHKLDPGVGDDLLVAWKRHRGKAPGASVSVFLAEGENHFRPGVYLYS